MNFKTVYGKDFIPRPITTQANYRDRTIRNPIVDSYIEYIKLDSDKGNLNSSEEYLSDYFENKFKVEHPDLAKRYFSTEVNTDAINKYNQDSKLTMYTVDYCDLEELHKPLRLYDFNLDFKKLPVTTHKKSYRDPVSIKDTALKRRQRIVPPTSIGVKWESDKLLGIKTGTTTYTEEYGTLGVEMIEQQMLGKIVHPDCSCLKHNL